jgi:hypothetical protein
MRGLLVGGEEGDDSGVGSCTGRRGVLKNAEREACPCILTSFCIRLLVAGRILREFGVYTSLEMGLFVALSASLLAAVLAACELHSQF